MAEKSINFEIMGMDGGIFIIKVEDLKANWEEVITSITKSLDYELKDRSKLNAREISELCAEMDDVFFLPRDIHNLTNDEILGLLKPWKNCDTPTFFNDCLIVGNGDNIPDKPNRLAYAIRGIEECECIETWT